MTSTDPFVDKVIAAYASEDDYGAYSDDRWPSAVRIADQVVSLLEAEPPARILDLACGSGASTSALALKGFDVTGMDCVPARIDVARRMSQQKGAVVQWLCEDMRRLDSKEKFDCVCLRDVMFGVFEAAEEDQDLVRRIAAALKPGGRCLFEVYNREFALEHGVERRLFLDRVSGRFVAREPERGGLSVRLYSHEEWREMLGRAGLGIMKMDGWRWPQDPEPPPWRADFIVAQKDRTSQMPATANSRA